MIAASLALLFASAAVGAPPGAPGQTKESPPSIVTVAIPSRPRVGTAADARLAYRAPGANVVAVVQTIEDLEGPVLRRATRQREINVLVQTFGREAGELAVPLAFASGGRKRITHVLVTDERAESDPSVVEVDVEP